ncbi:hypothetical protein TcWFU_002042 [Taenia crassiceps]|uniref:Uncharacterized protein n=1 Tax=Taenia crassiceps TaxID=6207 RepID=A0ABR4QA68_9CEST
MPLYPELPLASNAHVKPRAYLQMQRSDRRIGGPPSLCNQGSNCGFTGIAIEERCFEWYSLDKDRNSELKDDIFVSGLACKSFVLFIFRKADETSIPAFILVE